MTARLDPETKRLRSLKDGELADEAGQLKARQAQIKEEAIRRGLTRAEGEQYRLSLTPPGRQTRLDRKELEAQFGPGTIARFLYEIDTDWVMRISARRGIA